MQINNGIYVGRPNTASNVPKESYIIYNCVAEEGQYSNKYPIGSFNVQDRVYFPQSDSYGYIDEVISPILGISLQSLPFGGCDYRCNDSNVSLSLEINNDIGDPTDWYVKLYGIESFGEDIPVISYGNYTLNVQIYYNLSLFNGDNYINHSGTATLIQDTYNITSDGNELIVSEAIFSAPEGYGIWEIYELYISNISISNTYGPYNTNWDYDNRFLTDNGNVWTFYWPT